MKAHNETMRNFLKRNGIDCRVKLIEKGSCKGEWRFYQPNVQWAGNKELQQKFIELGFYNSNRSIWKCEHGINDFTGNGGAFCVFLRHPKFTLEVINKNFN